MVQRKLLSIKDYLKNATYKKDVVIKDKDGKTVSGNVVYNETKAPAESSFEIRDLPELKAGEWLGTYLFSSSRRGRGGWHKYS